MRKIYKLSSCAILLLGIGFTGVTYAATNASSSSALSATVATTVDISQVGPITIGDINPITAGNVSGQANACVYSNAADNKYQVTLLGDGAGQAFTIAGQGIAGTLAYTMEWKGVGGNYASVTSGTPVADQIGSGSVGCGSDLSSFQMTISEAAKRAATPGTYSGTLSIQVTAPA